MAGLDPAIHGAARTTGVSVLRYYPTLMRNPQFVASTARRPLLAGLAAWVVARQTAEAAEPLRLLTSGAFRQAADTIAALYERATGEAVSSIKDDVLATPHVLAAALHIVGALNAADMSDMDRLCVKTRPRGEAVAVKGSGP